MGFRRLWPRWLLIKLIVFMGAVAVASPLHIMLDPGHGGKDHGTTFGDLRECDLALSVSKLLAARLEDDQRFRVSLTRTQDQTVSLQQRADKAQTADVLISIHLNSYTKSSARGPEFYFQSLLPSDELAQFLANRENQVSPESAVPTADEAKPGTQRGGDDVELIVADLQRNEKIKWSGELAKSMHRAWYNAKVGRTRAVKQAPFYVISQTNAPSVLVELGYLSNPQEASKMALQSTQEQMAARLHSALVAFKEKLDKERKRP